MTIENTIETIFVNALSEIDYFSDNNIPVLNWRHADQEAVFPCVVVKAEPAEAEYCLKLPLMVVNLNITVATYVADDENMVTLNSLADTLQDYILNLDENTLSSNGIIFTAVCTK